jgi:hypothetical protein
MYDDGQFKFIDPYSKHPNILKAVITGKKSWGLWVDQWTDGITEWCFTREEILKEFSDRNIKIPDSFLKDFDNTIERKRLKRNSKYLEKLKEDENKKHNKSN